MRRYTEEELKKVLRFHNISFSHPIYHERGSIHRSSFVYYTSDKSLVYHGRDGRHDEGLSINPIPKLMWLLGLRL